MRAAGLALVGVAVQMSLVGLGDHAAGTVPTIHETTSAYMRDLAATTGVPGMAWAVIEDGNVTTGTLGRDGDGRPVATDTPFLWGSVAKPVTATAVMQLVEKSRIDIDDPIVDYVPWLPVHERDGTEVTVRHLLTHTSGFSTEAGLDLADRARNGPDAIRTVTRDLDASALVAKPGGAHRYSAINFLVLGALVEEVTAQPLAGYLDREVLAQAGMTGAITTADQAADRLPPGHRLAFGRAWSFDGPYDEAGLPFGYLGGTVDDGAALVRTLLADAQQARPARLLDARTLAEMSRPTVAAAGASYGLGWRVDVSAKSEPRSAPAGRMVWHSGATPGYFATVLMVPEDGLGVVVLANGYSLARDAQLNEAASDLLRIIQGDPPTPVGPDRLMLLAPWLLVAVAVGAVIVTLIAAVTATKRRRPGSIGGLTGWLVGLGALACAARLGLPAVTGQEWRTITLWAPGVAAGVRAILLGCLLAAAVTLVGAIRRTRQKETSS